MNTVESWAKSRSKMLAPLLPLIIVILNASFAGAGKIPLPEGAKEGYLYAGTNDSEPVIDFEPANDTDPRHPDFLYGPDTGHRVVEFYSPMCPHCRRLRPHYVELARQVSYLVNSSNIDFNVSFYAVSCIRHRPICSQFKITGYPQVKVLKAGSPEPVADGYPKALHPFEILALLGASDVKELPFGDAPTQDDSIRAKALSLVTGERTSYRRTKRQVFEDAYLSFDYSMRNLFIADGPLPEDAQHALKAWLELLKKSTPHAWKLQGVIQAIMDEFEEAAKDKKKLLDILDKFPKTETKWSPSCTKGQSDMGFTCGLWELFHIMSVGVVEWNKVDREKRMSISSSQASEILRNFIEHFFRCEECRINFLKSYDECELDRCNRLNQRKNLRSWSQLPLWLLETHNAVNVRLMKERDMDKGRVPTDDALLAARWPSSTDCPRCWKEDQSYDEDVILKHLRIEYWPEDVITAAHREELGDSPEVTVPTGFLDFITAGCIFAVLALFYRKQFTRFGGSKKKG